MLISLTKPCYLVVAATDPRASSGVQIDTIGLGPAAADRVAVLLPAGEVLDLPAAESVVHFERDLADYVAGPRLWWAAGTIAGEVAIDPLKIGGIAHDQVLTGLAAHMSGLSSRVPPLGYLIGADAVVAV
jgi:hypothetical protein